MARHPTRTNRHCHHMLLRTVVADDLRVAAHVKLGGHWQLVAAARQHHRAQALAGGVWGVWGGMGRRWGGGGVAGQSGWPRWTSQQLVPFKLTVMA